MDWGPWWIIVRAVGALVRHTILIVSFVALFYGVELLFKWLWGHDDPLFFDRVPLKWLFQSIDIIFIALFGVLGAREVYRILGGKE
jgi:hypothetical protein